MRLCSLCNRHGDFNWFVFFGFAGTNRPAHNSLYQMVKKRTLEARTKLQANKYPNHNACMKVAKTVEFVPDVDEVAQTTTVSNLQGPQISFTALQDPQFRVVASHSSNAFNSFLWLTLCSSYILHLILFLLPPRRAMPTPDPIPLPRMCWSRRSARSRPHWRSIRAMNWRAIPAPNSIGCVARPAWVAAAATAATMTIKNPTRKD